MLNIQKNHIPTTRRKKMLSERILINDEDTYAATQLLDENAYDYEVVHDGLLNVHPCDVDDAIDLLERYGIDAFRG